MKKFLLSGFVAVAMMFAGCTQDMTEDLNNASNDIVRGPLVTKKLVLADSRLSRDEQTGKLWWNEGDQVAVVLSNNGTYTVDTQAYTVDHTNGTLTIPENAVYVVYPYAQCKTLSASTLSLQTPYTITIASPTEVFDHNPMKGTVQGEIVEFNNLFGYVKVPLTGEGTVTGVTIKSDTHNGYAGLSRNCTIVVDGDPTADGGIVMAKSNEAFAWIKVKFDQPVDLASSPAIYLPVPENVYNNLALVIETAESGAYTLYAKNSHTVYRSAVQALSNTPIDVQAIRPTSPKSLSGTSGDSFNDFGNTYIVPTAAGNYSFVTDLPNGAKLDNAKFAVAAEIIWAEEAGMITNMHYDPATRTISFTHNGKPGNALVALTMSAPGDTKNVTWPWLLWCTEQPKDIIVPGGGSSSAHRYRMMDRVLGATWAPTSEFADQRTTLGTSENFEMNATVSAIDATNACGLHYQYQNMMPYPRIKDIDAGAINKKKENATNGYFNTRIAVMYGFHQWAQFWTSSGAGSTISKDDHGQYNTAARRNPQYMYNADSNKAWIHSTIIASDNGASAVQDLELDVTPVEGTTVKGYRLWRSCTNPASQKALKTNHDPCPAGYMLDNSSATYHYAYTRMAKFGYVRNPQDDTSYAQGYKLYGMYLNGCWVGEESDANKTALYFPCGGNRAGTYAGTCDGYGNMGYIYQVNTSTVKPESGGPYYSYTYSSKTYYTGRGACIQYGATGTSGTTLGNVGWGTTKSVNAQGYYIRCRKFGY